MPQPEYRTDLDLTELEGAPGPRADVLIYREPVSAGAPAWCCGRLDAENCHDCSMNYPERAIPN